MISFKKKDLFIILLFLKHDVKFNFYGDKMATCSSEKTIRIYAKNDRTKQFDEVAVLDKGHDGPIWELSWSHPKFGNLLASCSFDQSVIIWKELSASKWTSVHKYVGHAFSVNCVEWAPFEYGPMLACGSADGHVSVLTWTDKDEKWNHTKIHIEGSAGVNAISWGPPPIEDSFLISGDPDNRLAIYDTPKFVVGCCDGSVRIYEGVDNCANWVQTQQVGTHGDWVRDVAWSPNICGSRMMIASCSQACNLYIWSKGLGDGDGDKWKQMLLNKFSEPVWRVTWSECGSTLAVACGDNKITLWKESPDNTWKCVTCLDAPNEDSPPKIK